MVKRGWLKIFEAGIAILIILGFILVIVGSRTNFPKQDFNYEINLIIEDISKNESFRTGIIENRTNIQTELEEYVKDKLKISAYNVSVKICLADSHCFIEPYPDSDTIYTSERIISSNIKEMDFNPKKIKIFVWR